MRPQAQAQAPGTATRQPKVYKVKLTKVAEVNPE